MSEVAIKSFRGAMAALDAEREARQLSIPALATKAGTAWNTLYAWRKGARAPNLDSTIRLAAALGFEIVMRPAGRAPNSAQARHFMAHVLELREPIMIDGQKVDKLVFRRLKMRHIRGIRNPKRCGADLIAAATGIPLESFDSLCLEDRVDATAVLAQMSEMVESI